MHRHSGGKAAAESHQCLEQRAALSRGQILFAQTEPAAAAGKGGLGDLFERLPRLTAVGDNEKRRIGQPHRILA